MSKRVLILGGTRGLGRALSLHALKRGHHTMVTGRSCPDGLWHNDGWTLKKTWLSFAELNLGTTKNAFNLEVFLESAWKHNPDIIFWVAGHFLRQPFLETEVREHEELFRVHLLNPLEVIRRMLLRRSDLGLNPIHLVVVSSSSSWKDRNDGQVGYGAVQAAKVQAARNLHAESDQITRTTIVCPGGMKTEFFDGTDVDTSKFMDPMEVSEIIWHVVEAAKRPTSLMSMRLAQDGDTVDWSAFDKDGTPCRIPGYNPS